MKLSEFKNIISSTEKISFQLENKETIPEHFHITEIGVVSKKFIDCGGKFRTEKVINFQLWHAYDFNHRLSTQKVIDIISIAEKELPIEDLEIEVEYQKSTIATRTTFICASQSHQNSTGACIYLSFAYLPKHQNRP